MIGVFLEAGDQTSCILCAGCDDQVIIGIIAGFGLDNLLLNTDLFDRVVHKIYSLSCERTKTPLNLRRLPPSRHYPLERCWKLQVLSAFDNPDGRMLLHLASQSDRKCRSS